MTTANNGKQQVKISCKAKPALEVMSEQQAMSRGISLQPDEGIRDKIQYKVKTDDKKGIQVKVEYKEEYQDEIPGSLDDDITDISTQFEVNFDSIVEYAKPAQLAEDEERSDDEQAYDWDRDTILQTVSLTEWEEFTTVKDDANGVLSYFSARSVDGLAFFNFTISRADIGARANANTMKIDVLITDFPWMRTDTNLALMSTVKSKLKVHMEYNENAATAEQRSDQEQNLDKDGNVKSKWTRDVQISFDDATKDVGFIPTGEYKWQDLAEASTGYFYSSNVTLDPDFNPNCFNQTTVNGRNSEFLPNCVQVSEASEEGRSVDSIRVVATSPPQNGNETFQVIAYSFVGKAAQNATEIYWDPEAGISYSAAWGSAYSSLLSISSALAVSAMLFVAL